MDQRAERARMHRLGAHRPALEGGVGRAVVRQDQGAAEAAGDRRQHRPGPAVERVGTGGAFGHEPFPQARPGVADHRHRAAIGAAKAAVPPKAARLDRCPQFRPPGWFARLHGSTSTARKSLTLVRSEEHTSELQSLMRNSYAVFCLKKKKK